MIDNPVVICGYARTPMGGMLGSLAAVKATDLGAVAIKAALERAQVPPEAVDKVYMGCVLPAGLGQAPARQAALGAGLPEAVEATTLNKMCGSGMQTALLAADSLIAGSAEVVVAGGMENMSAAPYVLAKHRAGARMGHDRVLDSMFVDGLEDAYETGTLMGVFADRAAQAWGLTREAQDSYALRSLERAREALANGRFEREIAPVKVVERKRDVWVERDEQPGLARPERIPTLAPAFVQGGTVTAANASSISDGAAALVLTRRSVAESRGWPIRATFVAQAAHAQQPEQFTSAPVPALRKVLERAGWATPEVDLFEVNEAFAVVPLIAMQALGIPADKLNVCGGATALGHPIGASGARIVATLIAALEDRGLRRGVAAICIGGGEATALAVCR